MFLHFLLVNFKLSNESVICESVKNYNSISRIFFSFFSPFYSWHVFAMHIRCLERSVSSSICPLALLGIFLSPFRHVSSSTPETRPLIKSFPSRLPLSFISRWRFIGFFFLCKQRFIRRFIRNARSENRDVRPCTS